MEVAKDFFGGVEFAADVRGELPQQEISHIETRDEKQQCDRRRQNEQCRLQVAACHPRELFAQIADDRCDLCHPTSSGRFLNDTVMKPNQLALSARHGNARFESPEDSDRRVDGFS